MIPPRDEQGPVICIDLNGVLDTYTGWQGPDHFDPPRAGAHAFLRALRELRFRIIVFTTRHPDEVWVWLRVHGLDAYVADVTDRKPAAHVFVDDRAVCFRGDFDQTLADIVRFTAHWEPPPDRDA